MNFRPQDIVAILLAIGLTALLVSTSGLALLWVDAAQLSEFRSKMPDYMVSFWADTMNIMLGALAGYIAGRGSGP